MNFALIAVSTQLVKGPALLKSVLGSLKDVRLQEVSSVYRRIDPKTDGSLASEILVVVSVATNLGLSELNAQVREGQKSVPAAKLRLLTFNHEVRLEPENPIPNPDLHMDPLILHCAAEIQGVFEHPVLGRSLQELVKSSPSSFGPSPFEFLLRGEMLLDAGPLEVP